MGENNNETRYVKFSLGGMVFEYDEVKNQKNIEKHGISFRSAVRVFWDYDRIEFYDEENSVTRLISARYATSFERGLYYGKC